MSKRIMNIDYANGAHDIVMKEILRLNSGEYIGYGHDEITNATVKLIQNEVGIIDASVNFISGGTQTNSIAIKSFLKPHEAVISADIGHINVNECGAIEATGHKVIAVPCKDGKLTPDLIENIVNKHITEHMLVPKLVYLSNTLENGLVYNKEELENISKICKKYSLYLYLDGARLGQALARLEGDLTLKDIAFYTDAFYIGGTKNGMLYGEALVITNDYAKAQVRYIMKQVGAVLSKTWVIACQFKIMFEKDLFIKLGKDANDTAEAIYMGLDELGIKFYDRYCTNLIFPIFDRRLTKKLSKKYVLQEVMDLDDTKAVIRIATSYKTDMELVQAFLADVKDAMEKL